MMSGVRFECDGVMWEVVDVRVPVTGDNFLRAGTVEYAQVGCGSIYTIVRKVEPKFREVEVSDYLVRIGDGEMMLAGTAKCMDSTYSDYTLIPGTTRTIRIPIEEGDEQE